MRPRSPIPTLFPYTTLFRSRCYARTSHSGDVSVRRLDDDTEIAQLKGPGKKVQPFFSPDGKVLALCSQDRKSTRLNSSHLGISYAVFCLKKKINKTRNDCVY